jgi:hypothetical protein
MVILTIYNLNIFETPFIHNYFLFCLFIFPILMVRSFSKPETIFYIFFQIILNMHICIKGLFDATVEL